MDLDFSPPMKYSLVTKGKVYDSPLVLRVLWGKPLLTMELKNNCWFTFVHNKGEFLFTKAPQYYLHPDFNWKD